MTLPCFLQEVYESSRQYSSTTFRHWYRCLTEFSKKALAKETTTQHTVTVNVEADHHMPASHLLEHVKPNEGDKWDFQHCQSWLWYYRMFVLIMLIFGWKKTFLMVMVMAFAYWYELNMYDSANEDRDERIGIAALEKMKS